MMSARLDATWVTWPVLLGACVGSSVRGEASLAGQAVLHPGYRTFSAGARDRADAAREALMLAADTQSRPRSPHSAARRA